MLQFRKHFVLLCIVTMVLSGCREHEQFHIEVMNGYTPVKEQKGSQTCWIYGMLAAIETEHIMRGDSVNLSTAWVEHVIRLDPKAPNSKRGVAGATLTLIDKYGLVPYDAMKTIDDVAPRFAFMLGATYTPREFAHSVCAPDEYVGLGTTEEHPYYAEYVFDSPDNWAECRLLNLPPDSLLSITVRAVREHHGACWEGDTSEKGFDWKRGVARPEINSDQTTDDHCMAIVGLARDDKGEPYFVMKNSWGTDNAYDGLLFMHYDYFLRKTLAVYLPLYHSSSTYEDFLR